MAERPRIALALGDAAGIGAELAALGLVDGDITAAARFLVIGDRRLLAEGARVAGVTLEVPAIARGRATSWRCSTSKTATPPA